MKTKLRYLIAMLVLLDGAANFAQTPTFVIATNGVVGGGANSGTNGLYAILSGTNICFQLISSNGTLIGPLTVIGSGSSFPNAAFGGGKYLVYWDDNFIKNGPSTFGQIISPSGATIGSPFPIPSTGTGAPRALVSDGTNFLAVMEENNSFYGQIVTPSGNLLGQEFLISNQQQNGNSAAAVFGKTNYLVVWQSNNGNQGNMNQAFGAFVSGNGSAGSPFQISQNVSGDQNPLTVAFDGTNYLAIWPWDTGSLPGVSVTNWDLHGRLVSQSGTFPGSEVALVTDLGSQYFPSLTFDGANYLLAWGDSPSGAPLSGTNSNVRFRFFSRSATAIGPEFTLFSAQGKSFPAFGGVQSVGGKIAVGVLMASPIVGTNGSFQGFASASEYGAYIPNSSASPTLAAIGSKSGTQFRLQLMGTPGISYTIQVSTSLVLPTWTAITTNLPANATFTFTDLSATNQSRYYRAVH